MTNDMSIWSFILNAGFVVKLVMFILLLASVSSWMFVFERMKTYQKCRRMSQHFETRFWEGGDLNTLIDENIAQQNGLAQIFQAGMQEFNRLQKQSIISTKDILKSTKRAMHVKANRIIDDLEKHLNTLATIGSTSPYVGLLGTVWGIMTSFQSLGGVQQATIAMVAPGISEALIATAMGLFAAIPAVIAYNRFSSRVDELANQFENFQDELINILLRQMLGQQTLAHPIANDNNELSSSLV